ncbi:geranylgeranyltransferase type I beta subunit [Trypanosoma theileri]|uniref:Geranylgeranyl transferase type II subunit beta n=1 Tax=Trypanosoma theileri TaxID=67003 RepID=A0A1X0NZ61_9TRYP|nr:geranylgeranyltransferase type I beta subunit [Trypanosoma theileri]ORC89763.1 geranylgeranyltransferase type I beta subunit [Trypanosoma theileri]
MNSNEDDNDDKEEEEILHLLRDRQAHLRYFETIMHIALNNIQESHTQRLLLLYFALVGSDMMGAEWITSSSDSNRYKNELYNELHLCYDVQIGGFQSEPLPLYVTGPTVAMTHCALHILNTCCMLPKATLEWIEREKVISFILSCQINSNNSLYGSSFIGAFQSSPIISEVDIRFTYSALMSLTLLCAPLPLSAIPSFLHVLDNAVAFVWRCWNPHEGGFGAVPGAESHGGMTFCAVASLVLCNAISSLTRSHRHLLLRYCTARVSRGPNDHNDTNSNNYSDDDDNNNYRSVDVQEKKNKKERKRRKTIIGYQGRPQKDSDTCYTHWVGSTLQILCDNENECDGNSENDKLLIDPLPIMRFINSCTDHKKGGVSKCIGIKVDAVHSCLGLSGLLQHISFKPMLPVRPPHPVYGCSWEIVEKTKLPQLLKPR